MVNCEEVDCIGCGSRAHEGVTAYREWGVRRCAECSMLFVSPRPEASATDAIYDEAYFTGNSAFGNRSEPGGYQAGGSGYASHARELVRWVASLTGLSSGQWLDMGCGPGYLVKAAKDHGFATVGADVSAAACRWGRECLSLDLRQASAESIATVFPPGFNVITMVDLLSHLRRTSAALEQAFALLAPSGYLFAGPFELGAGPDSTGDALDVSDWGIPEHLGFPNEQSMTHLLSRLGFSNLRFLAKPLSPSDAIGSRLPGVPPWAVSAARRVVRHIPWLQLAVHRAAKRVVHATAGYVLAQRPGCAGPTEGVVS